MATVYEEEIKAVVQPVPEKKWLTIDKIIPKWWKRIKKYGSIRKAIIASHGLRRQYLSTKMCLVGEAHGYTSSMKRIVQNVDTFVE